MCDDEAAVVFMVCLDTLRQTTPEEVNFLFLETKRSRRHIISFRMNFLRVLNADFTLASLQEIVLGHMYSF